MRHFPDWLAAYIQYASGPSEAPPYMHFWSGVSAVAGALRRRVWINMKHFKWYCNHYVIIVAPPGVVSKTTTTGIAMNLLHQVKGIKFGPDVVTWPALVGKFAEAHEQFEYPIGSGDWNGQCAITLESGELGNLLNPQDQDMVNLLITLWDSKQGAFTKVTKTTGTDIVENPWINMIGCTTPAWIAANFPETMIGGGFTSRCVFVYAEKKFKRIAYPDEVAPPDFEETKTKLIEDLEWICNNLVGEYKLTVEARIWGHAWYNHHEDHPPAGMEGSRLGGYIARKQTHLHKLAMILAAAQRDELFITAQDLALADKMISDLELDMPKVFAKIGRTEESIQTERLLDFIRQAGTIEYAKAYRHVHLHFPQVRNFEGIIAGAIRAGYITNVTTPAGMVLKWSKIS